MKREREFDHSVTMANCLMLLSCGRSGAKNFCLEGSSYGNNIFIKSISIYIHIYIHTFYLISYIYTHTQKKKKK